MTAIIGTGVLLPGVNDPAGLLNPAVPGAAPVEPADLLGRKGLRYKDRATQLGMAAAWAALTDAGLLGSGATAADGDRTAVVVSSNLGNADTVCRAVATIAEQSTSALSPMDTPNASSNNIASEIAIRFGLRGPNLTLCSGITSGLDALRWGRSLLRSGRADRAVIVGVEPDNAVTRKLVGGPVIDGGAALVLGRAQGTTAPVRAWVGSSVRGPGLAACAAGLAAHEPDPALWLCVDPAAAPAAMPTLSLAGLAECSGALGVLYCAAAVGWFAAGGSGPAYLLVGDGASNAAGTVLQPPVGAA